MANVYYSCPFVPAELISACGHTPCRPEPALRLVCAGAETEGLCAWASAFVESSAQRPEGEAVVFTTACDQMRRAYELCVTESTYSCFLLNIPKTSGPAALTLLAEEYRRFARFLTNLDGGKEPSDSFPQCENMPHNQTAVKEGLAVVGGPLFEADMERLRQVIQRFGQTLMFDGTEPEWKSGRSPVDANTLQDASLATLARDYLTTPAVWTRPSGPFFDWLASQIAMCRATGVIIIQHPFCDYWRAAVHDIKTRVDVPVAALETSEGGRFSSAALSRLEAFLEQYQ